MIKTFIFDENKSHWLEEEHRFLSHDICAILDEDKETIYLWSGSKSSKDKFRKGYKQIKELIANFSDLSIQIVMVKKNFPNEIQEKIDSFVESMKIGKKKVLRFSRFTTIRIYSISILFVILLPILSFLYLSSSLTWSISNGIYQVNSTMYNSWIENSKFLIFITLILFSINIVIGIIENENQVIIFSLNGLIISIGLIFYLNQGIFLFLFQEGSTLTSYFILQTDIFIFLFVILIAMLIFEVPNLYKLISFFKTYRKFIS